MSTKETAQKRGPKNTRAKALLAWARKRALRRADRSAHAASITDLCRRTGIPRRSMAYALRRLEEDGAIRVVRDTPGDAFALRLEVL